MSSSVVLIDDNRLIIDAVTLTVDWASLDCEVIGTACDALSGIRMIRERKPDIIISDIKMPDMNGLEMIRLIRKEGIDASVIFLSGYSEFQYAQEALRLGAFDYLLKPIDNAEICRVIRACKMELMHRGGNEQDQAERRFKKSRYVSDLACEAFDSTEEAEKAADAVGVSLGCYSILMIYPLNGQSNLKKYATRIVDSFDEELRQHTIGAMYKDCLIFLYQHNSHDMLLSINHQLAAVFQKVKSMMVDADFAAAAVRRLRSPQQLAVACREAIQELEITPSKRGEFRFLELSNSGKEYNNEYRAEPEQLDLMAKSLILDVMTGQDGRVVIEEIIKCLHKSGGHSLIFLKNAVSQLCGLILHECVGKINLDSCKMTSLTALTAACHIDEVDRCLRQFAEELQMACGERLSKYSRIVNGSLRYINDHATENISLGMVAQHLHVSSAYLSGQIKKETGKNFVEIVMGVRMENVKQLMKKSYLSIDEISQMCGFKDYPHFYQVFKKYVGMSPKAYRNGSESGS